MERAEHARDKAIEEAQRRLEAAEEGQAIAVCGGNTLFPDRVHTHHGTATLTGHFAARVDTSGQLQVTHRPTATRGAVGCAACGPLGCLGSLAAPKTEKHDTRQVFLIIEGPGFSSVTGLSAREEAQARSFAAALEAAAGVADDAARNRENAVSVARQELARTRADRGDVEPAERELRAAEADTGAIADAERDLAAARDDSAVKLARERLESLARAED